MVRLVRFIVLVQRFLVGLDVESSVAGSCVTPGGGAVTVAEGLVEIAEELVEIWSISEEGEPFGVEEALRVRIGETNPVPLSCWEGTGRLGEREEEVGRTVGVVVGTVAEIPSVIIAFVTHKSLLAASDDDGSEVWVVVAGPLVGGAVCVDSIG